MYLPSPASHARLPSRASRTLPYPCPLKSPLRRQMPLALVALSASIPPPPTRVPARSYSRIRHARICRPAHPHARMPAFAHVFPCTPSHPHRAAPRRRPSAAARSARERRALAHSCGYFSVGGGDSGWSGQGRREPATQARSKPWRGLVTTLPRNGEDVTPFTPKWGRRDPLYTEMSRCVALPARRGPSQGDSSGDGKETRGFG